MSDWNLGSKYRTLLDRIQTVLSTGEKRTVRDVYYALESHGYDYDDREVKRAVKKGRRAGDIPPELIVDPNQPVTTAVTRGYTDPATVLLGRSMSLRMDVHRSLGTSGEMMVTYSAEGLPFQLTTS